MLFNSYEFIFAFLPVTLAAYYLLVGWYGRAVAFSWLLVSSLFFYGWWNPAYLGLLVPMILLNYLFGYLVSGQARKSGHTRRAWLWLAVIINLGTIAYFKYAGFLMSVASDISGEAFVIEAIALPLAISFFTFQQIAYLVDCYRTGRCEKSLRDYALFISFFPQLIAGPIVHHSEIMPQFAHNRIREKTRSNLAVGFTIFAVGLFKKCVLADNLAPFATGVFTAADAGQPVDIFAAWQGALAYSFQLYFDFSGYSDMAIGLARMFGFRLPLNFNAPYKARSIIDFWRRWHITLSRFLRDYLYIPLGGNRRGRLRRHFNLFVTMLLGGLWHGAAWTFVLWGALHGFYLIVNHSWHYVVRRLSAAGIMLPAIPLAGQLLTFLAVVVGWVFFRAESFNTALSLLGGMGGMAGASLPYGIVNQLPWLKALCDSLGIATHDGGGGQFILAWLWIAAGGAICFFMPTTAQFMRRYRPHFEGADYMPARFTWRPTKAYAGLAALLFILSVLSLTQVSEFLYFRF
ncbi:MBOAT family O-acyltransferase [Kordiimonas gwangyangensis]|uniref:MBOAT family O-acyltransferase n=1 Tax=Kordiimonas gwangyangensis TaxID=288022 RepID=UPI000365DC23|nr:MBOAT family O-acyltransferase [Kordiimonas gwangyangensis]